MQTKTVFQVIGLPGHGKTEFATALALELGCPHFNADDVRATSISSELGFSSQDRRQQAMNMGALAVLGLKFSDQVVVDFVCPTNEMRGMFARELRLNRKMFLRESQTLTTAFLEFKHILVIMDKPSRPTRFEDTKKMWEEPFETQQDKFTSVYRVSDWEHDVDMRQWVRTIARLANRPETLSYVIGRFQEFHDGHLAVVREGYNSSEVTVIKVRRMPPTLPNPKPVCQIIPEIWDRLIKEFPDALLRFRVEAEDNITDVLYGRDVGYNIRKVEVSDEVAQISSTQIRRTRDGVSIRPGDIPTEDLSKEVVKPMEPMEPMTGHAADATTRPNIMFPKKYT